MHRVRGAVNRGRFDGRNALCYKVLNAEARSRSPRSTRTRWTTSASSAGRWSGRRRLRRCRAGAASASASSAWLPPAVAGPLGGARWLADLARRGGRGDGDWCRDHGAESARVGHAARSQAVPALRPRLSAAARGRRRADGGGARSGLTPRLPGLLAAALRRGGRRRRRAVGARRARHGARCSWRSAPRRSHRRPRGATRSWPSGSAAFTLCLA